MAPTKEKPTGQESRVRICIKDTYFAFPRFRWMSSQALEPTTFLRENNCPQFQNSIATSNFIKLMKNLFDILNPKSQFGRQFKPPITTENYDERYTYLKDGIAPLSFLTDLNGLKIHHGPRKTFIQGFAIPANSILAISKDLLVRTHKPCSYILTYRFSQDPREMFFSKIRGRLGWNNNPNALQFKYALRALLLQVKSLLTANCTKVKHDHDYNTIHS